jgi:hypothetical protein
VKLAQAHFRREPRGRLLDRFGPHISRCRDGSRVGRGDRGQEGQAQEQTGGSDGPGTHRVHVTFRRLREAMVLQRSGHPSRNADGADGTRRSCCSSRSRRRCDHTNRINVSQDTSTVPSENQRNSRGATAGNRAARQAGRALPLKPARRACDGSCEGLQTG